MTSSFGYAQDSVFRLQPDLSGFTTLWFYYSASLIALLLVPYFSLRIACFAMHRETVEL